MAERFFDLIQPSTERHMSPDGSLETVAVQPPSSEIAQSSSDRSPLIRKQLMQSTEPLLSLTATIAQDQMASHNNLQRQQNLAQRNLLIQPNQDQQNTEFLQQQNPEAHAMQNLPAQQLQKIIQPPPPPPQHHPPIEPMIMGPLLPAGPPKKLSEMVKEQQRCQVDLNPKYTLSVSDGSHARRKGLLVNLQTTEFQEMVRTFAGESKKLESVMLDGLQLKQKIIPAMDIEYQKLSADCKILKAENAEYKLKAEGLQKGNERLVDNNAVLKGRLSGIQGLLAKAETLNEELKKQLQDKDTELKRVNEQNVNLNLEVDSFKEEVAEMEEDLKKKNLAIQKQQGMMEEIEGNEKKSREELLASEEALKKVRNECCSLRKKGKERENEIEALYGKIDTMKLQMKSKRKKYKRENEELKAYLASVKKGMKHEMQKRERLESVLPTKFKENLEQSGEALKQAIKERERKMREIIARLKDETGHGAVAEAGVSVKTLDEEGENNFMEIDEENEDKDQGEVCMNDGNGGERNSDKENEELNQGQTDNVSEGSSGSGIPERINWQEMQASVAAASSSIKQAQNGNRVQPKK